MKFICGSCNELIQEIKTSRYCGGAIPHEKCGSITTFEATDHPHTPKVIDVRPYFPKPVDSLLTQAEPSAPFVCKFCQTGEILIFEAPETFVHHIECKSGEGLDDYALAVRHALSAGLTATEAIELVKSEGAEAVLLDEKKIEGNNATQDNTGEGNAVVSQPNAGQAAPAPEVQAEVKNKKTEKVKANAGK